MFFQKRKNRKCAHFLTNEKIITFKIYDVENEYLFENFGSTFWDINQTLSELF
jgi:hypothetical protein